MKQAFDREGIDMPFPTRTIYFGGSEAETNPPERARGSRGFKPAGDAG